jgi:hypothetical protein
LNDVLKKLIESLNNGNILIALIIVAVAIVFNFRAIVDFFEDCNKARLSKLTEALQCEYLSEFSKIHLQEALATEHFKRSTGIRVEKQFRDAIIETHQNFKGELRFAHFKRALPYIRFADKKLTIRITKIQKLLFLYNLVFGGLLIISGLLFFGLTGFLEAAAMSGVFKYVGAVLLLSVVGVLMLLEALPMTSALHVRKELEKHENDAEMVSVNISAD